uniref:EF-hand domain-containing protein n=1 Tax=Steinernema glaseri TaxID=37863 RepID=A0A1I7Z773_9BILA
MTLQEQSEIQEVFLFYDSKGDNKIAVKQVGTALRSLGQLPTEEQIATLTQQWSDVETRISIEEFTPILHSVQKQASDLPTHEEFAECLAHFDRDGSGQVGVAEIRHMLQNCGEKMAEPEVDFLLRGMLDDNGKISINELIQLILS